MKTKIYVIYDGVANSVFQGQVMVPLMAELAQDVRMNAHLISFEYKTRATQHLPYHPRLTITILHKATFMGLISLRYAAQQLTKILRQYSSYSILARGPLAGLIATQAKNPKRCTQLIIQARGLLAEEYRYTHRNAHPILAWLYRSRAHLYERIEIRAYQMTRFNDTIMIESVSVALKDHLITTMNISPDSISISTRDLPEPIDPLLKKKYRMSIRQDLGINEATVVYCYNGSAQSWQCPEMIFDFFERTLREDRSSFLLILTPDQDSFQQQMVKRALSHNNYKICTVSHEHILKFLAAANYGLIFRESHVLNWISRPTKALEYQAAGLTIIHNNTVAWLNEQEKSPAFSAGLFSSQLQ